MAWYYSSQSGQTGPITESELAALSRAGTITPGTLVWTEGQTDWMPLSSVRPDLAGGFGAAPVVPSVGGMAVAGAGKDIAVQQLREGYAPGAGEMPYAGFWIRFLAYFIDSFLLGIVGAIVIGLATAATGNADSGEPNLGIIGYFQLLLFGFQWLYFALSESSAAQATLGKRACGLKVCNAEGERISFGRATGRFFGKIISSLTLAIGYIIAAFDSQKRALHDHIASTRVIRTR